MKTAKAFTLIEVMVVFAVIGIVVGIAAPTWFRQRELSRQRGCQENLSKIEGASDIYAVEFRLSNGASLSFPEDLIQPAGAATGSGYLKSIPFCPSGGSYSLAAIGDIPSCSIGTTGGALPHLSIQQVGH